MIEKTNIFTGIYRGVVISNYDPEVKGRCKIWVPSVYPESFKMQADSLPWAEPVMSLFGGSFTNSRFGDLNTETGVTTIPHNGAELWLFFENGDHNYPKFFGACQGGDGWHSEHNNQHVIKTDNVRIRIDEVPELSSSTCQFTTYNSQCTDDSIEEHTKEDQPTRVDIEIQIKSGAALNLKIKGDVNIFIEGDVYEDIRGNKHETLIGDLFRHQIGNSHIVQEGDIHIEHTGDMLHEQVGDRTYLQTGDRTYLQTGNETENQIGTKFLYERGDKIQVQIGNNTDTQVQGNRIFTQLLSESNPIPLYNETLVDGNLTEYIFKNESITALNNSSKIVGISLSQIAGIQVTNTAPIIIDQGAVIDHKQS